MATRKRHTVPINEGLFLFDDKEMVGQIETVSMVYAPEPSEVEIPSKENYGESFGSTESKHSEAEIIDDYRMITEMKSVLRQMSKYDAGKIRLISLMTTAMCQQGIDFKETYQVPAVRNSALTGYELAAWCYCSFMHAFPNMNNKLQLHYEYHYEKAKVDLRSE